MKAAVYDRYGPPEVLQIKDVEKPVPKNNEVLVRVHATTVCTADWKMRKAQPFVIRFFYGLLRPKKLRVLGMEFSGTVESVGPAVTRFRAGDKVFGGPWLKFGANAEYAIAPEDGMLAMKPNNMAFDEAAAVLFGGVLALYFLNKANLQPGQTVLIYGASGSVGTFAVQLAKHFGAQVTGVCSTANLQLVKSLGADDVVDYTRTDFSKAQRARMRRHQAEKELASPLGGARDSAAVLREFLGSAKGADATPPGRKGTRWPFGWRA